jgi:hypothetical protein
MKDIGCWIVQNFIYILGFAIIILGIINIIKSYGVT